MSDDAKLRLIMVVGILLIGSVIGSCTELKYLLNSETVDAKITRTYEESGRITRRGRTEPKLVIQYQFEDRDGELIENHARVSTSSELANRPEDGGHRTIAVQYRPGTTNCRLAGHSSMVWVWILAIAIAATLLSGLYFWLDYQRYEKASRASTQWR